MTQIEILLVSFLCMLFFLSPQYCCFRSSEFNNTLLYQNEGGRGEEEKERKHSHKSINVPVFQTCSKNYKTSVLLYASEVIYLINKVVISPYVQEQSGILLKLVSTILIKFSFFHQMKTLQILWKMLLISSKKLFSHLRYSNFCISVLPSFSACQPLL